MRFIGKGNEFGFFGVLNNFAKLNNENYILYEILYE